MEIIKPKIHGKWKGYYLLLIFIHILIFALLINNASKIIYLIIITSALLPSFILYLCQKTKKFNNLLHFDKTLQEITLENIGDGVVAVDRNGLITIFNPAAQTITGYTLEEALGKPINEIIKHKEQEKHFCNYFVKGIGCDERYDIKRFWIVDKEGKEKYITKICNKVMEKNSPLVIVYTIRDITEKLLEDRERELEQRLQSLGRLAGGIAHDFNNSLTILGGNADLVKLYLKSDNFSRIVPALTNMDGEVKRARQLTNKLLTFAKGGFPVKEPEKLHLLIEDGISRVLEKSDISIELKNNNKNLMVNVDREQMTEVFENIIKNARDAMDLQKDKLWIEVSEVDIKEEIGYLSPGNYALITIMNNGEKINEEVLPNIFEPFFSTKGNEGLGLPTCYSIIKNHHGHIKAESNDKFTTFSIYLPILKEMIEKETELCHITKKEQLSILVMDDEKNIREVCENLLTELGHKVDTAKNGEMAIEKYREKMKENDPYDLLILDLHIVNGLGGKETIKEILKINPQVKAIVSSGYSDDGVMANYKEYGFVGVLPKPFNYQQLKEKIIKIPLT